MENAKIVQGKLSDPAEVAKDGYEVLMSGERKIISGLNAKAQVAMDNVMPDNVVAEQLHKQSELVHKK